MPTFQDHLTEGLKLERYIIKEKLGEGGFGQVFKAFDEKLNREVAIKVLPRTQLSLLEGQILAILDNPHIVKIHDVLEGNQSNYLVMEYIPHSSIMHQSLSLDEILDLGVQVCKGLAEIHEHGFIHQDIKPGNILRDPKSGKCKITDFGIAAKTKSGQSEIIGTPKFMAPEQRRGGKVDQRTDIYGLARVINALIHHNKIPVVPAKLGQILRKASHSQASHRFKNVHEFKDALIRLQLSLNSWHLMEQVMPELGDGVLKVKEYLGKKKLMLKGLNVIMAIFATVILLRIPLIATASFYKIDFQLYLAPVLMGLVSFYSLSLAVCLLLLLIIPPLLISWASLGFLYGLVVVLFIPLIYRYPLIFIGFILASTWSHSLLLLAIPLLAGYYYGLPGGLLTGSILPFLKFISLEIPLNATYQEIISLPVPLYEGNWLIASFNQISLIEIWEMFSFFSTWIHHFTFDYGILGLILGIGAALVARRGRIGLFLYGLATGLGFLFTMPQMFGYWVILMVSLLTSILIKDKLNTKKKIEEANQLWNKPTLVN